MGTDQSIIIGCNNSGILPIILSCMKSNDDFNCVTATRITDLLNIVKVIKPKLIILSFRNNQMALDDIGSFLDEAKTPIVCLAKQKEDEYLYWKQSNVVITIPFENAIRGKYLAKRVRSILNLTNSFKPEPRLQSLTSVAKQKSSIQIEKLLSRYVLELEQKNAVILRSKHQIEELYPMVEGMLKMKLKSIVGLINSSQSHKKHWDDFKIYFESIESGFINELAKKHPSLTPTDLKYCCYLKMNMSNNDIKNLIGINQESVRTHKYRLKKKMRLKKNQDLRTYTNSFPSKQAG